MSFPKTSFQTLVVYVASLKQVPTDYRFTQELAKMFTYILFTTFLSSNFTINLILFDVLVSSYVLKFVNINKNRKDFANISPFC